MLTSSTPVQVALMITLDQSPKHWTEVLNIGPKSWISELYY